ncbi:MAG: hypothetical protein HY270_11490 [Deltaproteobacteria bacterium]|nr:hypothetical protein [Deltaproteobacteria bacterium]
MRQKCQLVEGCVVARRGALATNLKHRKNDLGGLAVLALAALLAAIAPAQAAYTEPRLALLRASSVHSSTGGISVQLEGSFSFPDVVQLDMPLQILVTQGTLAARFDLNGNVFTSVNGGPEQVTPGLGVVRVAARQIVLALPAGFGAGAATVQVVATYEGKPISSNRLGVSL